MLNVITALHESVGEWIEDFNRGLWLTVEEASVAAGLTAQAVSQAASREGNGFDPLVLGNIRYFHISWIAERWPDGPASRAFRQGVKPYREWVKTNLNRKGTTT